MADYIEPIKIAEMEELTSLDDGVLFVGEDDEDTKKLTFATFKNYINDKVTVYFGKSSDGKIPPTHDITESAILGEGILGQMILGDSAEWELEYPTDLKSDEYVWVSFYIEHPDDTSEWTSTFCLMDQDAKQSILEIQKDIDSLNDRADSFEENFENIQTEIESSNSEIDKLKSELESANSAIDELKQEMEDLKKLIGDTTISDMGDGTITGAIDSVRYGHAGPDQT